MEGILHDFLAMFFGLHLQEDLARMGRLKQFAMRDDRAGRRSYRCLFHQSSNPFPQMIPADVLLSVHQQKCPFNRTRNNVSG